MGVDMYVYIYIYWDDGDGSHIIVDNYISLYSGSTEYIYIYDGHPTSSPYGFIYTYTHYTSIPL